MDKLIHSDLERVRRMSAEEKRRNALSDPDAQPTTKEMWLKAKPFLPKKKNIHICIDEDILEYFKKEGRGYQTRINAVLRQFVRHNPR